MRQANLDLWTATPNDPVSSYLRKPSGWQLCRIILFSLVVALGLVAIVVVLVLNFRLPDVIDVADSIGAIKVTNCYITTDLTSPRGTTFVTVDESSDGTELWLDGGKTQLCAAILKIPNSRTKPLIIDATEATVILTHHDNVSSSSSSSTSTSSYNNTFPFDLTFITRFTKRGTSRVQVGGAKYNNLNIDMASGIVVIDATKLLPPNINIKMRFGVVSIPYRQSSSGDTPWQKIEFTGNTSLGGYCLTPSSVAPSEIAYAIEDFYPEQSSNTTTNETAYSVIEGTLFQAVSGISATTTIQTNCTSLYVTQLDLVTARDKGATMNATPTMRPTVRKALRSTPEWETTLVNKMFIQVIDIVSPFSGTVFLNTNSRFIVEFGVEFLSLLSGFQLTPSYRRMSTALSHYTCNNDTVIQNLSTSIFLTPADVIDAHNDAATARRVELRTETFIPDTSVDALFNEIMNLTFPSSVFTGFTQVHFDIRESINFVGTYSTFVEDGEVHIETGIQRTTTQWILLLFTVVLGVYVTIGALAVAWLSRADLYRQLYLHEPRLFVRQMERSVGLCPYFLYTSLYSFHAMLALQLLRTTIAAVRNAVPSHVMDSFISLMLRRGENSDDKDIRVITMDELVERYAVMLAARYAYRIDFERKQWASALEDRDFATQTKELDVIVGVAPAVMNAELGGEYCFDELYRTTGNQYDEQPATSIANAQFLDRPATKPTEHGVIVEAAARGLQIRRNVEMEVLTNAKWSAAAFVERISEQQAQRAEASFASFPAYLELRPDVPFPQIDPKAGAWAYRAEIQNWAMQRLEVLLLGVTQSVYHCLIAVFPFVVLYGIVDKFTEEATKYSMSARHFAFVELVWGWFTVETSYLKLQSFAAYAVIAVAVLAFLEPGIIIAFRIMSPQAIMLPEYFIRYPITIVLSFIYLQPKKKVLGHGLLRCVVLLVQELFVEVITQLDGSFSIGVGAIPFRLQLSLVCVLLCVFVV